jgi:hypothetical protein
MGDWQRSDGSSITPLFRFTEVLRESRVKIT